jgi:hypothetical protein
MGAGVTIFQPNGSPLKRFSAQGVDLNGTGDRLTFTGLPSVPYVVEKILIHGWSATPAAPLVMTLRDASSGGGNSLAGSMSGLNLLVTSTALALEAVPNVDVLGTNRTLTSTSLYLNASAGNGSALTANVTLIISIL